MNLDPKLQNVERCDRSSRVRRSAFTLVEVMIALGIFFVAVFAILGVMTNCLRNARALQQKTVDADMRASELSTSNILTEGLEAGDYGDMYPGYTWTTDTVPSPLGTNGLYQVDIIVQRPSGAVESKMSILIFSPQSSSAPGQLRRRVL
jgi:Tfp pilus assembly protein PilV